MRPKTERYTLLELRVDVAKKLIGQFLRRKGTVVFRSLTRAIDLYESFEPNEDVGGAPNNIFEEKQCMRALVATFIYVKSVVLLTITIIIRCLRYSEHSNLYVSSLGMSHTISYEK